MAQIGKETLMKKLVILMSILFFFVSCKGIQASKKKQEEVKREIIQRLPQIIKEVEEDYPIKYEEDNFYFIYGLNFDKNMATSIKYRGIIYSDKLKEYGYTGGVEIGLQSLEVDDSDMYTIANNYMGLLMQLEIDSMAENKAKDLFGTKVNLYNDGSATKQKYNKILSKTKVEKSFQEKSGYYSTIVNYFVEDLDKLNNEEIKQKTFELAKFIYDEMNYTTALQVYVRDNKYFEDYDLVYYSIYKPFREREDIVKILEKIKNKEKIEESEREKLVGVFMRGGLDFDVLPYKTCIIYLNEIKERKELTLDKIYLSN